MTLVRFLGLHLFSNLNDLISNRKMGPKKDSSENLFANLGFLDLFLDPDAEGVDLFLNLQDLFSNPSNLFLDPLDLFLDPRQFPCL